MEQKKLKSIIESLLFISGEPVKISRIIRISETSSSEVENAIMILKNEYLSEERGIIIIKKEDMVQMASSVQNSEIVSKLVKSEIQENISRAALEVLAITAYRGPLTRLEIELVRGVNSSFTLRSLLIRGLVERIENPKDNRGYLYKISFNFLKKMGLDSVEKLPDWETLSRDSRIENILNENA